MNSNNGFDSISPAHAMNFRSNSIASKDSFANNENTSLTFKSYVKDLASGDQRFMDILEGKFKKHQSVIVAPIHVPSTITSTVNTLKKYDKIQKQKIES